MLEWKQKFLKEIELMLISRGTIPHLNNFTNREIFSLYCVVNVYKFMRQQFLFLMWKINYFDKA